MKRIENLSKEEKIQLLKDLAAGKISVIDGEVIREGVVLIEKDGKYYVNEYHESKHGVTHDEFLEKFRGETVIILPHNSR
ncbi:hypothetical protein ACUNWD_10005 [Sunxiuqinia sp. A32]|uniref:hypothetical protein n=1 Tax=Sunxiuqinia sp. A32 TaxID=3461496 RepID=UPI0040458104